MICKINKFSLHLQEIFAEDFGLKNTEELLYTKFRAKKTKNKIQETATNKQQCKPKKYSQNNYLNLFRNFKNQTKTSLNE